MDFYHIRVSFVGDAAFKIIRVIFITRYDCFNGGYECSFGWPFWLEDIIIFYRLEAHEGAC